MKRVAATIETQVDVLTEPKPEFVSLVVRGANKTPFRVIKSADATNGMEPTPKTDIAAMSTPKQVKKSAGKGRHGDAISISFSTEVFKDEESVKKWLDENQYADYEIQKGESATELIVGSADHSAYSDVRKVDIGSGVTVTLGKPTEVVVKSGEDASEPPASDAPAPDAPAAASEPEPVQAVKGLILIDDKPVSEMIRKFDYWDAMESKGRSIAEVLQDANDGLPIGMYELNEAFYSVLHNLVLAGDIAQIRSLATEYGEMIIRLATISIAVAKTDESYANEILSHEKKGAPVSPEGGEQPPAEEHVEKSGEPEPEPAAAVPDQAVDAQPPSEAGEPVQKSEPSEFEKTVTAALGALTSSIAAIQKSSESSFEEIRKELGESKERIHKMETAVPARKGVDPAHVKDSASQTDPTQVKKQEEFHNRQTSNLLGMSQGRAG